MPDPARPPIQSAIQEEVARRRQCYREALVRRLYLKTDTFEFDHGWVDKDNFPTAKKMWFVHRPGDDASAAQKEAWNALPVERLFGDIVMSLEGNDAPIYTASDVLDFKPAPGVPCDRLTDYPVVRAPAGGEQSHDVFQSLARLDLAIADPGRQIELFGWTTPKPSE